MKSTYTTEEVARRLGLSRSYIWRIRERLGYSPGPTYDAAAVDELRAERAKKKKKGRKK